MSGHTKFKPKELWGKTMPFVWAKLMLRLVAILIGAIILGISIWIFTINAAVGFFAVVIGLSMAVGIYSFIVNIFGYAIRVGHVAVLAETIKTGKLPENQLVYGKDKVVSKIGTAAAFFALNRLVDRGVQELQRGLGSIAGMLGGLPGMGGAVKIGQKILGKALKYVDECCLGWIFYNYDKEQSATKGAIDGIVIYVQNWKPILGNAVKTTFMAMAATLGIGLVLVLVFVGLLGFLGGGVWGVLAFFLGLMVAMAVKRAFIDSWVMIRMLSTYMDVAPGTQIRFDVYGALSGQSRAFKKLCGMAQDEISAAPTRSAAPAPSKPVFCGECGASNVPGAGFCGECGAKV
ncbi:MAG: zinc ribbon domain-containing protein [Defluviitaleaceae bacterium]|nr:zinc ribbon domain-containing protein [Defluviitaleaceae bacterium]